METDHSNKQKVILIDDNKLSLESLQLSLLSHNIHVDAFLNPWDALRQFKKTRYNFLITDYKMPAINGADLLPIFKRVNPAIKTILYTGCTDCLIRNHNNSNQADFFLQNP